MISAAYCHTRELALHCILHVKCQKEPASNLRRFARLL